MMRPRHPEFSPIGGRTLESPSLESLAVLIPIDSAHQFMEAVFPFEIFHRGIEQEAAQDDLPASVGLAADGWVPAFDPDLDKQIAPTALAVVL